MITNFLEVILMKGLFMPHLPFMLVTVLLIATPLHGEERLLESKGLEVIRFKVGDELFEMKLAKIPGGTFMMGSSKREITLVKEKFADKLQGAKTKYGYDFEAMEPEHEVELSTFSMGSIM